MENTMTLLELSNELTERGFADIFDAQVDGECLDLASNTGSWADLSGDEIIYFDIIKIDADSGHLETIIKIK